MASRSLTDLLPHVADLAQRWLSACSARGVDVLLYCTWRSAEEQAQLYAIGRTTPGRRVTNARPWKSWHQMRRAWDAVPLIGGKPKWRYSPDDPDWKVMVEEADRLGIEWAGRWTTFREYVHFQVAEGLTLLEARRQVDPAFAAA